MWRKIIHAVFFYNNWRKAATVLLILAFIGCVQNESHFLTKETVAVEGKAVAEKVAFLTFDDGPSEVTKMILDILKEEDITATFFVIGEQITEEREEILMRMAQEGHLIGVHTFTHQSKQIYASADSYILDAQKTAERIEEVTGVHPKYFRFPWGSVNCYITGFCDDIKKRMDEMGYTYFDWNVSAEDSIGEPTKESILKNVRKDYTKYNEPVILMHDSSINKLSAEVLSQIIHELKEAGYEFSTVDNRSKPYQY